MEFCDQIWSLGGLKSDPAVVETLSCITGVTPYVLKMVVMADFVRRVSGNGSLGLPTGKLLG
jgi:hypothetical protein